MININTYISKFGNKTFEKMPFIGECKKQYQANL